MRTISFTSPYTGTVSYPNSIAFMYSRQPVIVEGPAGYSSEVKVIVTCDTNTSRSHTETRRMFEGRAEFDISRIMQTLARDVDGVLQRVDYERGESLAEVFSLKVTVGGSSVLDLSGGIHGMYGALDAAEVYGGRTTRRLFMYYPQTVNVWKDLYGSLGMTLNGVSLSPSYATGSSRCREVCPQAAMGSALKSRLESGLPVSGSTTWLYRIQEGVESQQTTREITFVPDVRVRGRGVYLRWLNRRGEVSYWLFDRRQLETAAAVSEEFRRHYEGDPAAPVDAVFRNEQKRNYQEQRRLGISASELSEEEFDELCTLLTSPVVEMLHVSEEYHSLGLVMDNGTAASAGFDMGVDGQGADDQLDGVDGGAAALSRLHYSAADRWIRVNVDGGTQARDTKFSTPRLHTFEASITLIERNTAKL